MVNDNSWFTTPQRKEQWSKYKEQDKLADHDEIVQKIAGAGLGDQPSNSIGTDDPSVPVPEQQHQHQEQQHGEQHGQQGEQHGQGGPQQQGQQQQELGVIGGDEVKQHTQTVGAVAIDAHGKLAAATSTGGRTNKWDGRIGDTPIIGAGG